MHIHIMMSSVKFNWALRQSTQTAIQHASMPKKSTFRLSSEPLPVLSCKQQTIALSMVRNAINTNILRQSIDVLSLVAIAHPQPQNFLSLSQIQWRHEPTIEHKYSLLELQVSTWPEPLLATESMQDHKQGCKRIGSDRILLLPYPLPYFCNGFGSERIMVGCGFGCGLYRITDMERIRTGLGSEADY